MRLLPLAAALVALPASALAADADTLVDALDLPADAVVRATTSGLYDQSDVRAELGPIVATSEDMVLLTSGYASQVLSGEDHDLGSTGYDPTEPSSPVYDQALLEISLRVPEGMHSLKFDWYFLSREYPYYVGSSYNDRFTVVQSGALFDGNIVFDEAGSVDDVNNALFTVTDALSLEGTGFWRVSSVSQTGYDGGGTGWVTTQTPVEPGEVVDLRIDVHDVADGVYDSGVVIDNFRSSEEEVVDPKSGADVELHWLSPKSASIEGGDTVLLSGRRFTADTRVWIGGVEVAEVHLHGDNLLEASVPASPDGHPRLVDVVAANDTSEATLVGGFTWDQRAPSGTPPEAQSVDPQHAEATGGDVLVVTGTGFGADSRVLFGDVAATDVELVSGTELRVTVPALEAGSMLLRVTDASGRSSGGPLPFVARTKLDAPADPVTPVPGPPARSRCSSPCSSPSRSAAPAACAAATSPPPAPSDWPWRCPAAAATTACAPAPTPTPKRRRSRSSPTPPCRRPRSPSATPWRSTARAAEASTARCWTGTGGSSTRPTARSRSWRARRTRGGEPGSRRTGRASTWSS